MSLFGFGKKKNLLDWQKAVVVNSPDRLLYTEEQLTKMTEALVSNDVRIITESMQIIAKTKNEDTRVSRQRVLAERVKHLETLDVFVNHKYAKLIAAAKRAL